MINCRRPSNRSSRLALPLGPSNSYGFSTASHGIRRRSAASASRARVNSFSFTSSCWRAASHSRSDTTFGVSIVLIFGIMFSFIFLLFYFSLHSLSYSSWRRHQTPALVHAPDGVHSARIRGIGVKSRRLLVCELSLEPAVRPARPGKRPDRPPQVLQIHFHTSATFRLRSWMNPWAYLFRRVSSSAHASGHSPALRNHWSSP